MNVFTVLQDELKKEANTTLKFLQVVPLDKGDFKPHEKSMVLKNLVTHIADIPGWIDMQLKTSELDFMAREHQPTVINSNTELIELFKSNVEKSLKALGEAKEEQLDETWTMRGGDKIYSSETKWESIRHSFAQLIHHRAQLGVYLRLMNVAVPASYGNSADDAGMFV